jgi:K+-transporting ATPase ATPase C chain
LPDIFHPQGPSFKFLASRACGLTEGELREMVRQHTEGRTSGVLGEPRVNVLALNLDLDASHPLR